MKLTGILSLAMMVCVHASAQRIAPADWRFMQSKEDSLKKQSLKMVMSDKLADRFTADSIFTRLFVRTLKTKNSFYYPFDSVLTVSKLYAPDSSFRIFTWQLELSDNKVRQHGAIQMRTDDGSFKRFPLIDRSDVTVNINDTIAGNEGWMGAVYYKIIQKEFKGHTYYTLLGFDQNNIRTDKKVMDILEFVNGQPVFGNKLFFFENGNVYQKNMARYVMEFKKEASPRLTYDPELDAIIFDELVSETGEPNKKWTLVPDGEYEGFKWKNGMWVYTKDVFGKMPVKKYEASQTIRDAQGNIDPTKIKGGEEEKPQ